MNKTKLLLLVGMVVVVAIFRFLPHPPNFVPITAIALFAGAFFTDKRLAFLLPLAVMFVSDIILGFHSTMPFVYGSFIAIVLIGRLLYNRRRVLPIALATIGSALLFFIVTNFGVWAMGTMYPKTIDGLITCYVAAIPFFRNALAGDIFYVTILFGSFALAERRFSVLQTQEVSKEK